MVNIIVSTAATQGPLPVVVKIKAIEPVIISAPLGTYIVVKELALLNIPDPLVVQRPPVATVTDPDTVAAELFAQTD